MRVSLILLAALNNSIHKYAVAVEIEESRILFNPFKYLISDCVLALTTRLPRGYYFISVSNIGYYTKNKNIFQLPI